MYNSILPKNANHVSNCYVNWILLLLKTYIKLYNRALVTTIM